MTTTSIGVDRVAHALSQIAALCHVKLIEVSVRPEALWFETARHTEQVLLLAAQVATRDCSGAAFLAAVLDLDPATSRFEILKHEEFDPGASVPGRCTQCPRWRGWMAGSHRHTPLSVTVGCARQDGASPVEG
ncbi:hypothetical protein APR04_005733 [Promicromonospora umidemergens]|uniref:Uncharacterized protein n=2 Tax=Promicromonospora TaxID=43676 RepID=A0ABP8Y415_9MICO|nr:hypothetical protein [Promicromonospora umidemergens]MCP2286793.1 hypothetical protein [Promicromonospora umidemergens]